MGETRTTAELSDRTLADLLPILKAATGPDREIDRALWYKLVFDPELAKGGDGWMKTPNFGHAPPAYTASLDQALALTERCVEPANLLDVEGSWEPNDKGVWPAWSVRWYPAGTDRDGKSWHAQVGSASTPALALLVALIQVILSAPTASPVSPNDRVHEAKPTSSLNNNQPRSEPMERG